MFLAQILVYISFMAPFLRYSNSVCFASLAATTNRPVPLKKRTPPNTAVCSSGGSYGRPNRYSCTDAWAIVQPGERQQGFTIHNFIEELDDIAAGRSSPRQEFELGTPGAIRTRPDLDATFLPKIFPAAQCIISISLKEGAVRESDIASNEDLLETAWSVIGQCVHIRGVGGYEMTGENSEIKVAVYSANSKWDKQIRSVQLQTSNNANPGGTATDPTTGNSEGGTSSGTSGEPKPAGSKPKKTRPTKRCEATGCGEDYDCCEQYSCRQAINPNHDTMELAWGTRRFSSKSILSWCMMSIDQAPLSN